MRCPALSPSPQAKRCLAFSIQPVCFVTWLVGQKCFCYFFGWQEHPKICFLDGFLVITGLPEFWPTAISNSQLFFCAWLFFFAELLSRPLVVLELVLVTEITWWFCSGQKQSESALSDSVQIPPEQVVGEDLRKKKNELFDFMPCCSSKFSLCTSFSLCTPLGT